MTSYVLEAQDVAIHYGGVKAVDGVAITLEQGQIRGLIGPNGAGKSTVIDAITGRVRLTRGSVSLGGQDVTALSPTQRRMRGLSRSFQRTSVFGQMPVRRQVELASHKTGVADSGADADAVLKELELDALADVTAVDLGYGEQAAAGPCAGIGGATQRAAARDERVADLSVKESLDLAKHLKALTSRWNVSVLLVEHDMDVVFGISDVVTVFELGRVIASGEPAADARRSASARSLSPGSAA